MRRNKDYENELNLDPFAIGYPLIEMIDKKTSEILLIDINGKVAYNGYEDYIFDIDRCQIAQN